MLKCLLMITHTVSKIAVDPVVLVGDLTSFVIVVSNEGMVDLGDVFVREYVPDGLTFVDYSSKALWSKVGDVFYYNGILRVGESANFTIVFNTTRVGNFTNVVVAGSNLTDNMLDKMMPK